MTLDHIAIKNAAEALHQRWGGLVIVGPQFVASEINPIGRLQFTASVGMVVATAPSLNEAVRALNLKMVDRATELQSEVNALNARAKVNFPASPAQEAVGA